MNYIDSLLSGIEKVEKEFDDPGLSIRDHNDTFNYLKLGNSSAEVFGWKYWTEFQFDLKEWERAFYRLIYSDYPNKNELIRSMHSRLVNIEARMNSAESFLWDEKFTEVIIDLIRFLDQSSQNTSQEIYGSSDLKREIRSTPLKAIALYCQYAGINVPKNLDRCQKIADQFGAETTSTKLYTHYSKFSTEADRINSEERVMSRYFEFAISQLRENGLDSTLAESEKLKWLEKNSYR